MVCRQRSAKSDVVIYVVHIPAIPQSCSKQFQVQTLSMGIFLTQSCPNDNRSSILPVRKSVRCPTCSNVLQLNKSIIHKSRHPQPFSSITGVDIEQGDMAQYDVRERPQGTER